MVIVHDSYMSVVHIASGEIKTTPMPVIQSSSLVVVAELACVIPSFDQWTNIVCMSITTFQVKTCPYLIYAGGLAFVDTIKEWVYAVDQDLEPQSMYKFTASDGYLHYMRTNPDFGEYTFGNHLWFSYNGSVIFLDNGLTLAASSNPQTDMTDLMETLTPPMKSTNTSGFPSQGKTLTSLLG